MKIPVWIEPVSGNGYRAKGGEPFPEVGEGATPDQALEQLKNGLQRRLAGGALLVELDLTAAEHPWLPFAGMFREQDPVIQEWLTIMKQRREEDETTA
jgi:hypothetical protein